MQQQADFFRTIPFDKNEQQPPTPYWTNPYFPPLDSAALMTLLKLRNPKRLIEIGGGNSTLFAKRAIVHHGRTKIVSIDPEPRAEIEAICDEVHRVGLENIDSGFFDTVTPEDIVFFDGSHHAFSNSDVTVFFLEVIPKLPNGTLVHIHDIFLPLDYPPDWMGRYFSEQFLLATMLLSKEPPFKIVSPNAFMLFDELLGPSIKTLPCFARKDAADRYAASFWIEIQR